MDPQEKELVAQLTQRLKVRTLDRAEQILLLSLNRPDQITAILSQDDIAKLTTTLDRPSALILPGAKERSSAMLANLTAQNNALLSGTATTEQAQTLLTPLLWWVARNAPSAHCPGELYAEAGRIFFILHEERLRDPGAFIDSLRLKHLPVATQALLGAA